MVERVAGWSVRHRKTAVIGWLLLVVVAVLIGQRLGTANLNSYDPGQAGRAERVLAEPVVQQPDSEDVLIQGRSPGQTYAHSGSPCGRSPPRCGRCRRPQPTSSLRSPAPARAALVS
jgi:RND superfamily putative drug exporter